MSIIVAIIVYCLTRRFFLALGAYFLCKWLGSLFLSEKKARTHAQEAISVEDFLHELLIFTAAVMKSDGRLLKVELSYVRGFLVQNLGERKAQEALLELRDILEHDYDLVSICHSFRNKTALSERLLMLKFLFGVAAADGQITQTELELIRFISQHCGMSAAHFESLKAMYMAYYAYDSGARSYNRRTYSSNDYQSSANSIDNDYKILGIPKDATDDEVKKAFRTLAKEHHPDRVSHLGEEMRKAAEEKFVRLNDAYERIKKARGMK